jgi:hypothetical protein
MVQREGRRAGFSVLASGESQVWTERNSCGVGWNRNPDEVLQTAAPIRESRHEKSTKFEKDAPSD